MKMVKHEDLSVLAKHAIRRSCKPGTEVSVLTVLRKYGLQVALLTAMCCKEGEIRELLVKIAKILPVRLELPGAVRVIRTRGAMLKFLAGKVTSGYLEKCAHSVGSRGDVYRFSSYSESEKLITWLALAMAWKEYRHKTMVFASYSKDPAIMKAFKEWANE